MVLILVLCLAGGIVTKHKHSMDQSELHSTDVPDLADLTTTGRAVPSSQMEADMDVELRGNTDIHDKFIEFEVEEAPWSEPTQDFKHLQHVEKLKSQHSRQNATLERLAEADGKIEEDELTKLRRQRLAQLKASQAAKYGTPITITALQFTKEVQTASLQGPVIMLLYVSRVRTSNIMLNCITTLAAKHKNIKFALLEATEEIANFSPEDAPALLTYKDGLKVLKC